MSKISKKKLLNTLYRKIESELTDKELLTGKAYHEYASNVADGITDKYGSHTNVKIIADESPEAYSAYTDGDNIVINAWCNAYTGLKNLTERHWCILGRIVHECGHLLWTNFKALISGQESIATSHKLYPKPDGDETELTEFLDANPSSAEAVTKLWHGVANSIEDGFIEKLLLNKFQGYGQYLQKNREIVESNCKTYAQQKNMRIDDLTILTNLILDQAKFGRVKEFEQDELNEDIVQIFFRIRPLIDAATDERASYFRQKKVNELFLEVFKVFKEEAEKQASQNGGQNNQQSQNGQGNNGQQGQQEQNNQNGGHPESQGQQGQQQGQNGGTQQQGTDPNGGSEQQQGDPNAQSNGNPSPEEAAKALAKAIEQAAQAASSKADDGSKHSNANSPKDDKKTSQSINATLGADDGPNKSNTGSQPHVQGGQETPSNSLENIRKQEIQSQVEGQIEKQIEQQLYQEIQSISHDSGIHNGVPTKVKRVDASDGEYLYNVEHQYLDTLARRMMKNLLKEIKDRQLGDALDGNYYGNRLDTNNLYRRDKKLYIRDILPEDIPDMEVAILIDCSGSMSGAKIDMARKTAYTVWKFCQMLSIPVSVLGHDTTGSRVNFYSVADGESIDGNDGKRIFSLDSGGCNRDGFAFRYASKKLMKSTAQDRILFVISDGCPNHTAYRGYGRAEGQADIQDAVAKAKKEGICVITAGIGESAADIREVWTKDVSVKRAATFLELTELERLPKSFVKVIKKQIAA